MNTHESAAQVTTADTSGVDMHTVVVEYLKSEAYSKLLSEAAGMLAAIIVSRRTDIPSDNS